MSDLNGETFLRLWAEASKRVLDKIRSMPPEVDFARPSKPVADENASVWLSFRLSAGLQGGAAFCVPLDDAIQLAGIALGKDQEGVNQLSAVLLDALQKVFQQFATVVSSAMQAKLGREVKIEFEGGAKPKWQPSESASLTVQFSDGKKLTLAAFTNVERSAAESQKADAANGNIELLRDVKLDVTLRFGQKQLLLKEVLALDTGAVIELDKEIESAVDLLLGERVIARGDVVIVDGNYGLRVTEVIH